MFLDICIDESIVKIVKIMNDLSDLTSEKVVYPLVLRQVINNEMAKHGHSATCKRWENLRPEG